MTEQPSDVFALANQIVHHFRAGQKAAGVQLLRDCVAQGMDLQGAHVDLSRLATIGADWDLIESLLPPQTNSFRQTGWMRSLVEGTPVDAEGNPLPWFTYPSIDFLESIIDPDWRVFEWGSGFSTLWWSRRVAQVDSVEDNEAWFQKVSADLAANAQVQFAEGEDYVAAIEPFAEPFDVVVVDGSLRNECAAVAASKVKPGGIIVFDNADKAEYAPSHALLKDAGWYRIDFWGLIPSFHYRNCTSVYFRDPAILVPRVAPCDHHGSLGVSCMQAEDSRLMPKGS